jgi:ubiquinone/menaquinone biosynthesis C-methylase UbiE
MQAFTKNLLELWYELIGGDHHKDRDCHFYIEKNFSTYKKSEWRLSHHGYLLGEIAQCFNTYQEAEKRLQNLLAEKIQEFCETETLDQRNKTENRVLENLKKLLEGNDSPADEPSNSERR